MVDDDKALNKQVTLPQPINTRFSFHRFDYNTQVAVSLSLFIGNYFYRDAVSSQLGPHPRWQTVAMFEGHAEDTLIKTFWRRIGAA